MGLFETIFLLMLASTVVTALVAGLQKQKEEKLLEKNPEAYKLLKATQVAEEERKRRNRGRAALKGAGLLARMFLKK